MRVEELLQYYNPYIKDESPVGATAEQVGSPVPDSLRRRATRMYRYGIVHSIRPNRQLDKPVVQTTNSSIHALCVALDYPGYNLCVTEEDKEDFVRDLRQRIWVNTNPNLLKQELYDYDDSEILEMFTKNEYDFTPTLFYRAFEEFFNINVYVFSPPRPKSSESEIGFMNIPRYKIFHTRTYRPKRKTVLLFLTWGSESNSMKHPHCELIVEELAPNVYNMVFPVEMTQLVHNTLLMTTKTLTWPESDFNLISDPKTRDQHDIGVHENLYGKINYLNIIPYRAVSQLLDSNGKLRALTFVINEEEEEMFTIGIFPSQPEIFAYHDDSF